MNILMNGVYTATMMSWLAPPPDVGSELAQEELLSGAPTPGMNNGMIRYFATSVAGPFFANGTGSTGQTPTREEVESAASAEFIAAVRKTGGGNLAALAGYLNRPDVKPGDALDMLSSALEKAQVAVRGRELVMEAVSAITSCMELGDSNRADEFVRFRLYKYLRMDPSLAGYIADALIGRIRVDIDKSIHEFSERNRGYALPALPPREKDPLERDVKKLEDDELYFQTMKRLMSSGMESASLDAQTAFAARLYEEAYRAWLQQFPLRRVPTCTLLMMGTLIDNDFMNVKLGTMIMDLAKSKKGKVRRRESEFASLVLSGELEKDAIDRIRQSQVGT
ncbi:MAG: hypothetical protein WC956_01590 [bacterium]